MDGGAWWAAVHGVAKSQTQLSSFTFTFHFHALEKEIATHSSVLAWRIPGMGEPGGLLIYGVAQSRTRVKWLSSSSIFIWNPDSQWEGIMKWLYPEDTALILGMSALRIREISFPSTTWGHRGPLPVNQKVASHQIPSTLELLFGTCQPPELWDRNVCCLSHPTYGIFFI